MTSKELLTLIFCVKCRIVQKIASWMQIGYSLGIDVNGTFNGEILYQMGKNILIDKQIQSLFFSWNQLPTRIFTL